MKIKRPQRRQKVVIYGAGGMGRELAENVADAAGSGAPWEVIGFLDDAPGRTGLRVLGWPVLGPGTWIAEHRDTQVMLGIGHPLLRRTIVQRVLDLGGRWATFVHPSSIVFPSARLGDGTVVFAGAIVSSCASLAPYSYVNYQSVVSHDAVLGQYSCLMTHVVLAGSVKVGEGSFLGVGVSTRQNVGIGDWTIVGAGATVIHDIPSLCVATGTPARTSRSYASPEEMPSF